MLRVSASHLETFRKYLTTDYVSEADVVASIKGEGVWSDEMKWGAAFHSILEKPDEHRVEGGFSCDGHFFKDATVEPCLAIFNRDGVFEVKHTRDFEIGGHTVTLVTKADQLHGSRGIENKTKWSPFDFDVYQKSYQWRCYILVFGLASITYNVFLLHKDRHGDFVLNGIETFTLYPYPEIEADCVKLLTEFVDYVKLRGLEEYLQPDRYKRSA